MKRKKVKKQNLKEILYPGYTYLCHRLANNLILLENGRRRGRHVLYIGQDFDDKLLEILMEHLARRCGGVLQLDVVLEQNNAMTHDEVDRFMAYGIPFRYIQRSSSRLPWYDSQITEYYSYDHIVTDLTDLIDGQSKLDTLDVISSLTRFGDVFHFIERFRQYHANRQHKLYEDRMFAFEKYICQELWDTIVHDVKRTTLFSQHEMQEFLVQRGFSKEMSVLDCLYDIKAIAIGKKL